MKPITIREFLTVLVAAREIDRTACWRNFSQEQTTWELWAFGNDGAHFIEIGKRERNPNEERGEKQCDENRLTHYRGMAQKTLDSKRTRRRRIYRTDVNERVSRGSFSIKGKGEFYEKLFHRVVDAVCGGAACLAGKGLRLLVVDCKRLAFLYLKDQATEWIGFKIRY